MSDHTIVIIWVVKIFFLQFFCVFLPPLLTSAASVRSIPFLSIIEPIFAWNVPLLSLIFLKRSGLIRHPVSIITVYTLCSWCWCPSQEGNTEVRWFPHFVERSYFSRRKSGVGQKETLKCNQQMGKSCYQSRASSKGSSPNTRPREMDMWPVSTSRTEPRGSWCTGCWCPGFCIFVSCVMRHACVLTETLSMSDI